MMLRLGRSLRDQERSLTHAQIQAATSTDRNGRAHLARIAGRYRDLYFEIRDEAQDFIQTRSLFRRR